MWLCTDADPAGRPVGSMCHGYNGQIHMDYRNPVEKKGRQTGGQGLREPDPCLDRLLLLFWAHYIPSFTMHRFAAGDYLLQITKERMLLITSKRRIKRESG